MNKAGFWALLAVGLAGCAGEAWRGTARKNGGFDRVGDAIFFAR